MLRAPMVALAEVRVKPGKIKSNESGLVCLVSKSVKDGVGSGVGSRL